VDGFNICPPKYDRWLSPEGIYFVPNSPLLALRFAMISATQDRCEPVVIASKLIGMAKRKMLDLTSDSGLNKLYKGYERLEVNYKYNKHELSPRTPDSYFSDLKNKLGHLDGEAGKLLELNISHTSSMNWDSAALRLVAMENNCSIIAAAIQEGNTFNLIFSGKNFNHRISKNYHGIRIRDHIEVCVLDANLIRKEIKTLSPQTIKKNYSDSFVHAVLDYRSPDSEL
jgi:hypothetical protein